MAKTQGNRRSGRIRKVVNTYAEEEAEQIAPTAKRKQPATEDEETPRKVNKKSKSELNDEMARDLPTDTEPPQDDEDFKPKPKKARKKAQSQSNEEAANDLPADIEPLQDDEDFKPKPKKARKKRAVPAIGKLDSEGVMRLDVTEMRPPGEKRPPKVYPIPPRSNAKGKSSVNLAAVLAESFEDRWERKVSKIPRLAPGQPEVRLKNNVPYMTESYKTFLHRATTQKMFVLSRTQGVEENCHANHEDCPIHQIKIAGTTGNVYTIIISHMPTCSCPNTNFKRADSDQALCKHVQYVLHYVLKAPQHLCYQNAFLTSELKEITANAPALPTAVIEMEENHDGHRKPVEDDCPICCMEFKQEEDITWCRAACGNNIHQDCFNLWAQTKAKDNVTCPYCRTLWRDDKPAKSGEQSETLTDVKMTQRTGGYFNVRDQLSYD